MSASPRRRRRTLIALLMLAIVVLVTVTLWPRRRPTRGFLAMNNPHGGTVVRSVAPHLGAVGELLLRRDCGSCHGTPPPPAPASPPRPKAPEGHPGGDMTGQSCVSCHAATAQG